MPGWLSERRRLPPWWPLAAILIAAGLLRLASMAAAAELPLFDHHRLDAAVYHEAGQRIAAGDLALGDEVLHMSPGYSFVVGAVYAVAGEGWPLRLLQIAFGVTTCALVYLLVLELGASRRWALLGAGVCAAYGPLIFYESHLLAATTSALVNTAALLATLRARQKPRRWTWAVVGALWGVAILLRPTALLLAAPIAVAAVGITGRPSWRARGIAFAIAVGAAAAVVAPITVRNAVVGGEWVLVTDSGGLNFYIGNGPGANGTFRIPPHLPEAKNANAQFAVFRAAAEAETGRSLSSKDVSDHWYGKTWDHIGAEPGTWLRLVVEKAWLVWNRREIPNTHDYRFGREVNPVLGLPLVGFGVVAPFAILGLLWLVASRDRGHAVVALFVAVQLASLIAFFVLARYRLGTVPTLIAVAVFGAHALRQRLTARRRGAIAASLVVLALAIPLALWPKLPKALDDEYFKLGFAYHLQGDLESAELAYIEALDINAGNPSANKNLARLYESIGAIEPARARWRALLEIARERGMTRYVREAEAALRALEDAPRGPSGPGGPR